MPYPLTSWRAFSATMRSWWASAAAQELRAAYHDTRRVPGWVVLGMIAVFSPLTGFSLVPIGVTAGAWLLTMWITRSVRYRYVRRRVRRIVRPLIGVLALIVLIRVVVSAVRGPAGALEAAEAWHTRGATPPSSPRLTHYLVRRLRLRDGRPIGAMRGLTGSTYL